MDQEEYIPDRHFVSSIFLLCTFLLSCTSFLGREISYSLYFTMTPLALLLIFFSFSGDRPYQRGSWLIALYIFVNLIAFIRGFWAEEVPWQNNKQMLLIFFDPSYTALLLPLVAFMKFQAFSKITWFSIAAAVLFWILLIYNIQLFFAPVLAFENYEEAAAAFRGERFMIWCAMIALFLPGRLHKKIYYFLLVTVICGGLLAMILGRRGTTAMVVIVLLLSQIKQKFSKKLLSIALLIGIMCFLDFMTDGNLFFIMQERGIGGSREHILDAQIEQTTLWEWIFGKGIFGYYISEDFVFDPIKGEYVDVVRFLSECGFFDIILHTGIIGITLHILGLGIAMLRGFFFSNSIFAKSLASLILIALLELAPYGVQRFDFFYFIIWIFASFLYSPNFCRLSDGEINELIDQQKI